MTHGSGKLPLAHGEILPASFANPHRERLVEAFGPLRPDPKFKPPDIDFLFILFTNRCGSNFLAHALASTGSFNEAGEFFNADTVLSHASANDLPSLPAYFCFVSNMVAHGQRMTAKLGIEHVAILAEAGILDAILGRSRFILIERRDKLAQGISRVVASQNLQWTSEQAKAIPNSRLVYSRSRIDEEIQRVDAGNGLLYRFLATARAAPRHFSYEALVTRTQSHLDEVAAWLDLQPLQFDPGRVRISPQSSPLKEVWRRRYLAGD